MSKQFDQAVREIIAAGQRLEARGLAPATSGNYSVKLPEGEIAITVSGRHKGRLTEDGVMRVDAAGKAIDAKKPSAETLLHTHIYKRYPDAGAILHAHSKPGVVLTRFFPRKDKIILENYELLKAFPGVTTHEVRIEIPVFDNTQDMEALAADVDERLENDTPAYLIRDHGIYAWGRDMDEAERTLEALEHLLQCEIEIAKLRGAAA